MTKVMVFGTFDILHPGHEFFLREAKKLGDKLIVIVGRDKTVSALKGSPPENGENIRLDNIIKTGLADKARLGNLGDKFKVLNEEKPDVIALGYDQTFLTDELIKKFGSVIKIVRMPSHKPEKFKSSLMRAD